MKHSMMDLETFGTRPGCAIRSIGACLFDPYTGETAEDFYVNVDRESCRAAGLWIDPNTEAWWSRQSQEAQTALLVDPKPLGEALQAFSFWWGKANPEYMWSQGANFDGPLLEACYNKEAGMIVPWSFYNARDTRTLYHMARLDTRQVKRGGTYHNALDDCKFQAKCCSVASQIIWPPEPAIPATPAEKDAALKKIGL
jgi:hypothetical protein